MHYGLTLTHSARPTPTAPVYIILNIIFVLVTLLIIWTITDFRLHVETNKYTVFMGTIYYLIQQCWNRQG